MKISEFVGKVKEGEQFWVKSDLRGEIFLGRAIFVIPSASEESDGRSLLSERFLASLEMTNIKFVPFSENGNAQFRF